MVKVGIIGTGGIYRGAHLDGWKTSTEAQIVAVCDANIESAQKAQEDFPGAEVFSDYKELLKRTDIDAVSITTPNKFHSIIAIEALEAGKHVFCEKPDAINPEEAEKMARIAKESGKVLMVMRNNRFSAAAQHVKKLAAEGYFGELYAGRCGWIRTRGIPGRGGWFTTKELSGGGPLIDLGVHMIDLAMWLSGNQVPKTVSGATYRKFADRADATGQVPQGTFDVEDLAMGFIRFNNGAALQLEFSWASNVAAEKKFLEWRGTEGGFALVNDELTLFKEQAGEVVSEKLTIEEHTTPQHTANIHHFIDCVLGRAAATITPEEGVHMIQILSAIYESAETGSEVQFS